MSAVPTPSPAVTSPLSRPLRLLYQYVPALDSLRTYSWRSLRLDLVAGITVAAVAVPQAMAYASIAGLDPRYGLYTAIVMTAVGALFDSSRQLINGPTNAISIALLSALALPSLADTDRLAAAILLAFMIGVIQTGITLFRLGDLTRYISHAVIVGFTLGAAVLLVLDQFKNLLGLPARGDAHNHFLVRFYLTIREIDGLHVWTMLIGLGTIVLALALRLVNKRLRLQIPEFLATMIVMAGVVWLLDLENRGVPVVGYIPPALPSFEVPQMAWTWVRDLAGSALAIAILGLLEAIAMAKAIAARTAQKLDINQQCLSEGVANLTGSFFQCFPGSGSLTRSAINVQAGAVSQWSGVFAAAVVAIIVLVAAPYARFIPRASLAGILLISAWRLVDQRQLFYHLRASRFDARIVAATALSAVFVSVEFCILIGVFMSFVLFVPRAARVHMTELTLTPERVIRERIDADPACNRIAVVSLEGELFFGSAPDLERHFETMIQRTETGVRIVVLRIKRVRNADAVCLELFGRFFEEMQRRNVTVLLCGVRRDMAKSLRASGLDKQLGGERIFLEKPGLFSSTLDAVRKAYDILGPDVCETCPRRGEQTKEVLYFMI
jgi:SulP family sulfate permease